MESTLLGIILDSRVIIEAERKRQNAEESLTAIRQRFGEIEIAMSAVTIAELVHGIARANTAEIGRRRRGFIDELKKHVPAHPVTDETGEIAGKISGEQALRGVTLPIDDLLIGASALDQGYCIATRNERHFRNIPDLEIVQM
jgi:predicted nucleic acid-binding protein